MIAELKTVRAGLPDQRKGPHVDGQYTVADSGLSAFALFFTAIAAAGVLKPFHRQGGRMLIARDGTECFASRNPSFPLLFVIGAKAGAPAPIRGIEFRL